jgi:hypothetical protein
MIDLTPFAVAFQQLCHAFGKHADADMTSEYFKAFQNLTEPQVKQLFQWAVENIEIGFPRIATLKHHAASQGWYRTPTDKPAPNHFIYIICSKCGGRFVIRRPQLEQDALANRWYRCVNHLHWHCPESFQARTILGEENR